MNEYPLGQEVKITLTFKNDTDQLIDPSDATLELLHPDKTTKDTKALADFDHVSTGIYTYSFVPGAGAADAVGRWKYWGQGVGAQTVAAKGHFLVTPKGT